MSSHAIHWAAPITAVLAALSLAAAPAAAQETEMAAESSIQVSEAVIATAVEDREPVGAAESFADVERVYFYTVFEGDFPETEVEHVWLHEGEEMARVTLRAQGPRWRTWSSKAIPMGATGEWEAQVIGPDGDVLASASFTIDG